MGTRKVTFNFGLALLIALAGLLAAPEAQSANSRLGDPRVVTTAKLSPSAKEISPEDCQRGNIVDFSPPGALVTKITPDKDDAVVQGTDGNDWIVVPRAWSGRVIKGKNGDDLIEGTDGSDDIRGGLGTDYLVGYGGDDRLVGDSFSSDVDLTDPVLHAASRDCLSGGGGSDVLVGDNMALEHSATGGADDVLMGGSGIDTIVGDSWVSGNPSRTLVAKGAGNDWLAGSQDEDTAVGDDYASGPGNRAEGSSDPAVGADSVNLGPGDDFGFGDNLGERYASVTGASSDDGMIWPTTIFPDDYQEANKKGGIHLQNESDVGFGDNGLSDAPDRHGKPFRPAPDTALGGNDELGGYDGADTLYGGPGDDLLRGDSNDNCTHQQEPFNSLCMACPDHPEQGQCTTFEGQPVVAPGYGTNWNDKLFGGSGNDHLYGVWGDADYCDGGGEPLDNIDLTCELP